MKKKNKKLGKTFRTHFSSNSLAEEEEYKKRRTYEI